MGRGGDGGGIGLGFLFLIIMGAVYQQYALLLCFCISFGAWITGSCRMLSRGRLSRGKMRGFVMISSGRHAASVLMLPAFCRG